MSFHTTSIHALALLFCIAPALSCAMEHTKPSSFITKKVMVTLNENRVEPQKVPLFIKIAAPASVITDEARNDYYASRKAQILSHLQQVLIAYEKEKTKNPLDNHFVTITPTEFVFNPDENTLDIRENWQTHRLTDALTANLETRMLCTYAPEGQVLRPSTPILYITAQGTERVQTVAMKTLHALYPHQDALHINPTNGAALAAHITGLAFQRDKGLMAGKKAEELPDPEAYQRSLYGEDLKKMTLYFLDQVAPASAAQAARHKTLIPEKNYHSHFMHVTIPDYSAPDYCNKRSIPVQIQIEVPESIRTADQVQTYYATRAQEYEQMWSKAFAAYSKMMAHVTHLNHFVPLVPTSFYFYPQTNLCIIRCAWGTHDITKHVNARLETRYHCIYNPQEDRLEHRTSKLHIIKTKENETTAVEIDTLNELFPSPSMLNCTVAKMPALKNEFQALVAMRVAQIQTGTPEANLPDPIKILNDKYQDDLIKLAANYVHHQITELIGGID